MGIDEIIEEMPEYQQATADTNGQSAPTTSNGNGQQRQSTLTGPSIRIQTPGGEELEATTESLIVYLLAIQTLLLLIIAVRL